MTTTQLPFTDWRVAVDADLARISMPREAHAAVFNVLQAYERQAQAHKQQPTEAPK